MRNLVLAVLALGHLGASAWLDARRPERGYLSWLAVRTVTAAVLFLLAGSVGLDSRGTHQSSLVGGREFWAAGGLALVALFCWWLDEQPPRGDGRWVG